LYPSLQLEPFFGKPALVLVRAVDGIKMCSTGGTRALRRDETTAVLAALDPRQAMKVRVFLSQLGLRGVALTGPRDADLRDLLRRLVATGELVGLRLGAADASPSDESADLRKLIRDIEALVRGRLRVGGGQYRLVAGPQLGKLADRDQYQVVGQAEARKVLDTAAQASGGGGPLVDLLGKASTQLSRDWRPPLEPDGLVLLRRIPRLGTLTPAPVEALSPSALRKLRDEGWIEVVLVDAGMEPIADADYEVKLPDGQTKMSKTDKKGATRFEGIMPGECLVRFPKAKGPVGLA
jgi:hypothetical protein